MWNQCAKGLDFLYKTNDSFNWPNWLMAMFSSFFFFYEHKIHFHSLCYLRKSRTDEKMQKIRSFVAKKCPLHEWLPCQAEAILKLIDDWWYHRIRNCMLKIDYLNIDWSNANFEYDNENNCNHQHDAELDDAFDNFQVMKARKHCRQLLDQKWFPKVTFDQPSCWHRKVKRKKKVSANDWNWAKDWTKKLVVKPSFEFCVMNSTLVAIVESNLATVA